MENFADMKSACRQAGAQAVEKAFGSFDSLK